MLLLLRERGNLLTNFNHSPHPFLTAKLVLSLLIYLGLGKGVATFPSTGTLSRWSTRCSCSRRSS